MCQAIAEKFNELTNDPFLAEHLCHGQDEVRGRGSFLQLAGELEADNVRNEHRDWLAEHGSLRFDAAYAPAQHAESVDHRRVRVRADYRIRVCATDAVLLGVEHDAAQVFEIDLVNDARIGRHYAEVVESRSSC